LQEVVFSSSVDEARATGASRAGVGQTLAARWNETARFLADCAFSVLFPADCRICGDPLLQASRLRVCQACRDSVVPIQGNLCPICGERTVTFSQLEAEPEPCALCRCALPPYSRAIAYGAFEDALRETIHLLKYDRVLPAANLLGKKLSSAIAQLPVAAGAGWLVIPVPLHKKRSRQRGFNQSELIARAALKMALFEAKLNTACLVRQRETVPQAGLTRHERRKNIRGAFLVRKPATVQGREILLVDDVFTNGTTIAECARVLRQAGAASVYAATVARALKEDRIGSKREGNSARAREAA
jgi:ComF family protein